VRFLGVLDAGSILPRAGIEVGAIQVADGSGCLAQRTLAERRRVGAVVGDDTVGEQALRRAHGPVGREPQLAVRLLLQRGGRERRGRLLGGRTLLDRCHRPRQPPGKRVAQAQGGGLAEQADRVVLQLAARVEVAPAGQPSVPDAVQAGRERRLSGPQTRLEVPVRARPERGALLLALDDEPHRHALHAAGAQPGLDLLPQHRGHHVAVQAVDDPSALLRVDELLVDLAGLRDRAADRLLGDLVELDAPDRHLRLEDLAQVPADRLALAVGVGGEQHLGRVLHRRSQVPDTASLVLRDHVVRAEAVFDVHAHAAPRLVLDLGGDLARVLREVADVADTGLDAVLVAKQARECPGLGRRLDNDERLRRRSASHGPRHRFGSVAPALGLTAETRSWPRAGTDDSPMSVAPRCAARRHRVSR
jgi:hypothetical protein